MAFDCTLLLCRRAGGTGLCLGFVGLALQLLGFLLGGQGLGFLNLSFFGLGVLFRRLAAGQRIARHGADDGAHSDGAMVPIKPEPPAAGGRVL